MGHEPGEGGVKVDENKATGGVALLNVFDFEGLTRLTLSHRAAIASHFDAAHLLPSMEVLALLATLLVSTDCLLANVVQVGQPPSVGSARLFFSVSALDSVTVGRFPCCLVAFA